MRALKSPVGTEVTVEDNIADDLIAQGWTEQGGKKSSPAEAEPSQPAKAARKSK